MSKDRMLLERFSTTIQLLKNKIDKIERAKKLFATDSSVHDILMAANLEKCCSFVEDTNNRLVASQGLKTSLKVLRSQQSILSKYHTVNCRKFEEHSDQIYEIIQARKLLKCIDQHDFKEALKIAGLNDIIKKGAPWISRIWITENTFFENLDKYLEVKRKEYKIIVDAYKTEDECRPSAPELSLSTPPEGSSNCNNTYVTNNNYPAVDSTSPSVPPLDQHLYPLKKHAPPPPIQSSVLSPAQHLYSPKKSAAPPPPQSSAPPPPQSSAPPPPQSSAPPSYNEAIHDASYGHDLLGDCISS